MVKCNPATLDSGGDMAVHNGTIYSLMGAFGPHKSTDGSTWEAVDGLNTPTPLVTTSFRHSNNALLSLVTLILFRVIY